MSWQKHAWRLYQRVSHVVLAVPGLRPLLKRWPMAQSLVTIPRRLLMTTLPDHIVTGDSFRFTIYLPDRAYFFKPEALAGTYERDTVRALQDILLPGMTLVDLGAHLGYFSLIAATCVGPSGRVYAFEPQPEIYDLLVTNIEVNDLQSIIRPARKAVSNTAGTLPLFLGTRDSGEASFYHTPGGSSSESVVVEVTTLDAFCAQQGWPPVHVIKMDIEGAEMMALEGLRELASRSLDLRLIMEFNPNIQAAAGVADEELFEALLRLGFHKFSALHKGVQPLKIPQDIPRLLRMAGDGYVNLLCEK